MKVFSDIDRFETCEAGRKNGFYDGYNGQGRIFLQYIGHTQLEPGDIIGPMMSDHYIYHLVFSGSCIYRLNNMEWRVNASEGFMVFPNQIACYEADMQHPCANYFIAFTGLDAPEFVERTGLSVENPIVHHEDVPQCRSLFNAMIDHIQRNDSLSAIMLPALLQLFIGILAHDNISLGDQPKQTAPKAVNQYIQHAVHIIQSSINAHLPLNIPDIAAQLGIDPSYFSRIFKKTFGTSPAVYIQNHRLEVAKSLLLRTSMSVKEIAYRVGFDDSSYFTRCFTRHFRVTPSKFRQEGPQP